MVADASRVLEQKLSGFDAEPSMVVSQEEKKQAALITVE
jgi:hypothetical protein